MSTAPHVRPDIALVGVRGTTEPQTGSNLLRPLGDRIIEQSPHHHTTYTELAYPATFDFAASVGQGVRALADLLNQSTATAPHRLHVLMGYSQGAWVIGETLLPPHSAPQARMPPNSHPGRQPESARSSSTETPASPTGNPSTGAPSNPVAKATTPARQAS